MNLTNITKSENSLKVLTVFLFLIVFSYAALFVPLLDRNDQIQDDIASENELSLILAKANQQLSSFSQHSRLSQEQMKQKVGSIFLAQGVKLSGHKIQAESSTASIKNISFVSLIEALKQLKTQNGIVVSSAVIDRIGPGIVSAQLTFSSLAQ